MRTGEASGTAIAAASMRAAHLHLFDGPKIHEDSFALQLVGLDDPEQLRAMLERIDVAMLRRISAYFALRHRFSEERLHSALQRGVRQVVLLGAGLDTFALRHPELPKRILFVEVDHPASQQFKLGRLAALGLETPSVKYLPVDFASQNLEIELASAGVQVETPTFFAWLGVTQYISADATSATLSLIARHGPGSEVVFDVIRPIDGLPVDELLISAAARDRSAERGEPWISYFVPEEFAARLEALGFSEVTRLTAEAAVGYYRGQPRDIAPLSAWELIAARV